MAAWVSIGCICLANLFPSHDKAIYLDCDVVNKAEPGSLFGLLTEQAS
jgi:lipopolysaccharide biosynthesis glycosyltransferase